MAAIMPCYHPLSAFKTAGGDVVWAERGDIVASLFLPCGQCIGCRLERSRQWAVRIMHEASLFEENCFLTLTYDDEYVPKDGSLVYGDFQRFLKRLRRRLAPTLVRFFVCGEYGDSLGRPHFHCALFGFAFRVDRVPWKTSGGGFMVDRSALLESFWPFGFSSVGDLSFESAAYIARYVTKKVTGRKADDHYRRVDVETGEITWLLPEFVHMSLKPGIGGEWFKKFGKEVFPVDRVIARGVPCKPPRYYDVLEGRRDPDVLEAVKMARIERAIERGDNSDARLVVKEIVATAANRHFKRELK